MLITTSSDGSLHIVAPTATDLQLEFTAGVRHIWEEGHQRFRCCCHLGTIAQWGNVDVRLAYRLHMSTHGHLTGVSANTLSSGDDVT